MIRCDDGEDERVIPGVRPYRGREHLKPEPPDGWLIVVSYGTPPDPTELGAWYLAVEHAQHWSKTAGEAKHMVARGPSGLRYLLVHPNLKVQAADLIDEMDERVRYCNCGGYDCLAPDIQEHGMRTFAKRRWAKLSIEQRLNLVEDIQEWGADHEIDLVLQDGDVFDTVDDVALFHRILDY